ncbi:MAG: hypothetical protein F6K47_24640 [Symploca sp. SIO2E6]|nr:hypothetical protein [Symploca sp. SIO2E6]
MKRRDIIKYGCVSLTSAAIPSVIAGCGLWRPATKKIAILLLDFLIVSGFKKIAENYPGWVNSLRNADKSNVKNIQMVLSQAGFTNFVTPVYIANVSGTTIIVYGAEKDDGIHVCAPCYTGSSMAVPMIEAPVIMGISAAAKKWNVSDVSRAEGLVPLQAIAQNPCNIQVNTSSPLRYRTKAGTLTVTYRVSENRQLGTVSLVAERDNGGKLFGGDYDYNLA